MPLTAKGARILEKMIETYGEEEGTRVFYASKNSGTIEGVDAMPRLMPKKRKVQSLTGRPWAEGLPLCVIADVATMPSQSVRMYDAVEIDDDAKLEITSDGYLKAMPRIARTGIQLYHGDECGRPDLDVVRVYRPEASVFANVATHSYTHLPVTIEHPGVMVDAGNWKKHAVGETGDEVLRDGGTVRVPMMLRDSKAIALVKDGKKQLSVGYGCDLSWGDGVSPEGEQYDAVQSNIKANHLAIVSQARGGPTLSIGDTTVTELTKTVLIDGLPIQVSDKDALIVQRTITQLQDQNENFKKMLAAKKKEEDDDDTEDAKRVEDIKTKDALIATLQQQLKDAMDPNALDAKLADRDQVRLRARALMGDAFKVDGKKIEDIRREVVLAKSNVPTAKDWADAAIEAVFTHLTSDIKPRNPINDARAAFASGNSAHTNPKAEAYAQMVKDSENAWRNPSSQ